MAQQTHKYKVGDIVSVPSYHVVTTIESLDSLPGWYKTDDGYTRPEASLQLVEEVENESEPVEHEYTTFTIGEDKVVYLAHKLEERLAIQLLTERDYVVYKKNCGRAVASL